MERRPTCRKGQLDVYNVQRHGLSCPVLRILSTRFFLGPDVLDLHPTALVFYGPLIHFRSTPTHPYTAIYMFC
jgi:hypothetical protein